MFPVSSYETAPDGRDFIGSGPTGYATCGRKPQPADTEIPDANMLGTWKLHNRHPTIGEKTFTPATPRSLLPSIPKADIVLLRPFPDISETRVPKRTLPHPSRIFRRLRCFYCWSNFFTASEIARPSARPANCFVATPITLPISDGALAPTCSIMAFKALSSSTRSSEQAGNLQFGGFGQFVLGQFGTTAFGIDGGRLAALLDQLLDDFPARRRRLSFRSRRPSWPAGSADLTARSAVRRAFLLGEHSGLDFIVDLFFETHGIFVIDRFTQESANFPPNNGPQERHIAVGPPVATKRGNMSLFVLRSRLTREQMNRRAFRPDFRRTVRISGPSDRRRRSGTERSPSCGRMLRPRSPCKPKTAG